MHRYGFHGNVLKWLSNYVHNRLQYVSINGIESERHMIQCGVPQGSILGPLLFLIYMNDLAAVSNTLCPILFADDTNLLISNRNFSALMNEVNNGLHAFSKWFQTNKLALNVKKSHFMIFAGRMNYNLDSVKVYIDGEEMIKVTSTRFLGILIDEKLTWKEHISFVCNKVTKSLGIIRKISALVHSSCFLTLYYSLVCPYLTYCNIVWASTFPTYLQKILLLQKRFVRMATFSKSCAPTAPLFLKCHVLAIFDLNVLQICTFIFKLKYMGADLPQSFQTFFICNSQINYYATRQINNLYLPRYHTSRGQFSLRYRGVQLWNTNLHLLTDSLSLSRYKMKLKEALMSKRFGIVEA